MYFPSICFNARSFFGFWSLTQSQDQPLPAKRSSQKAKSRKQDNQAKAKAVPGANLAKPTTT
jgi:hypothetical protein